MLKTVGILGAGILVYIDIHIGQLLDIQKWKDQSNYLFLTFKIIWDITSEHRLCSKQQFTQTLIQTTYKTLTDTHFEYLKEHIYKHQLINTC